MLGCFRLPRISTDSYHAYRTLYPLPSKQARMAR